MIPKIFLPILVFVSFIAFTQTKTPPDKFNIKDFASSDGRGSADDTNAIAACMNYAHSRGGSCTFPPGDFRTTKTIQLKAQPPIGKTFADISVISLAGSGHATAPGSAATAGNPTYAHGTRIICAVKGAPCLDIDLSNASFVSIYLSNIAFVGPDAGPAGAVSGDAIRVHGGAEPRMILDDVAVGGFYGAGTWAFDIDGAEGSEFRNLLCVGNNGCLHGFDSFNGNVFTNVSSSQTTGPAAFLFESVDALTWTGGTIQASAGDGIVLHGTAAMTIQGAYFECNNAGAGINCKQPKPAEKGGAIVIRGNDNATNQYFTLSGLFLAGDRTVCYSTGKEGLLNVFGLFQQSYMNGTPSPQVLLDASCGHMTGHNFSGPGKIEDAGADNVFTVGNAKF